MNYIGELIYKYILLLFDFDTLLFISLITYFVYDRDKAIRFIHLLLFECVYSAYLKSLFAFSYDLGGLQINMQGECSCPSGHTIANCLFWFVFIRETRLYKCLIWSSSLMLFYFYIMVDLRMHIVSDILFGILFSTVPIFCYSLIRTREEAHRLLAVLLCLTSACICLYSDIVEMYRYLGDIPVAIVFTLVIHELIQHLYTNKQHKILLENKVYGFPLSS